MEFIVNLPLKSVLSCIFYRFIGNIYTKNYKKDGAIARSLLIDERFGSTSILRASSLLKNSTIKNRERFKNII